MTKTAYISGKITGLPKEDVKTKFGTLATKLQTMGLEVVTPVALVDDSKSWDETVRSDIKKMMDCDELHMLHNWQDSKGAMLTRDVAIRLGIKVVYH